MERLLKFIFGWRVVFVSPSAEAFFERRTTLENMGFKVKSGFVRHNSSPLLEYGSAINAGTYYLYLNKKDVKKLNE